MANEISGHCECRGVEFSVDGPLRPVINCHCGQCHRTHGNFAAYSNVKNKDLTLLSEGTLQWYRSSDFAERGFCNRCGASLFWRRVNDESTSISAGMFIQPSGLATAANIFVEDKPDFYGITDGLAQHDRSGS